MTENHQLVTAAGNLLVRRLSLSDDDNEITCSFGGQTYVLGQLDKRMLQRCRQHHAFYSAENRLVADGFGGRYAIVKRDLSIIVVSTQTEALERAEQDDSVFMARIGMSS